MNYTYKQLEQELSALSKVFSELGARLSEVAKEVTAPGVVPSERFLEQISTCRTDFENVRSAVHAHAAAMLVSPLPKIGELVSVATIDSLLKAAAIAEETKCSIESERDQALAILRRVLAITHRETDDFKPLQECHTKVGELRSSISNTLWPHRRPEAESIAQAKHPATDLLHFVENLDQIDDERWMALETTITEKFGKPLFVAASRGKLAVQPDAKPAAPPVAAERPAEKKTVVEKVREKPAQAAPAPSADKKAATAAVAPPTASEKPAPKPAGAPAPAPVQPVTAEKKPAAQTPVVSLPPSPAPAPVAAIPDAPARPAASAAITPPSVPPPPQVQTAAAVFPAASASAPVPAAPASPLTVTMNSLTALASATEPEDKKPASVPVDTAEKQRKEPRLATSVSPSVPKLESNPQELPETSQPGIAADGSQRPQRWGFWRGNR